MSLTTLIAKHIRDVHFGGNWTTSNLKDTLSDVDWLIATKKIEGFNTIAMLVFHCNYYVSAIIGALKSGELNAHDKFSYDVPEITKQIEWEELVQKTLRESEILADVVEKLPDSILTEDFVESKYGNYFRNLHGLIEHTHYHLGQIVIVKKMIMNNVLNLDY